MTYQHTQQPDEVVVFIQDSDGNRQPQTFQLCPLGVQFYSDRRIEEFELMEFDLHPAEESSGAADKPIKCTGAVVRCQEVNEDDGKYRIWIKFLDAPQETCDRLKCTARKGKHLCCFCENF